MMNYLLVAKNIFDYLARHQIRQKEIVAPIENGWANIVIKHPIRGTIEDRIQLPDEGFFRFHGIGLKVVTKNAHQAVLDVYDNGGIFDAIDDLVPGEHYATTHFALLGAILYRHHPDPAILEQVKLAIDFHLRTSPDEYRFGNWMYHWDFQNYAFLETYRLLKEDLTQGEKIRWEQGLKQWQENDNNSLTNWIAMRAYSARLRYELFHWSADRLRCWWRWQRVQRAQQADGCYDDFRNASRPIQYHVFTLALLHRLWLLNRSAAIRRQFLAGVNYFIAFIDPEGSFNYLGRGQEQIFGYGVAIYVLEAAKSLDEKNALQYQTLLDRLWRYLVKFEREGVFPLVLNAQDDRERCGWYDYHHFSVYNAFLGVWLALAHLLRQPSVPESRAQDKTDAGTAFHFFKPTKNVIFSNQEYFAVFSAGTPEYLSEPGISPVHLWFREIGWVFSCPGGPTLDKYGKIYPVEHIEKNLLAPIVRMAAAAWLLPAYREGQILSATSRGVVLTFDYGPFQLKRSVFFEDKRLVVEDRFRFTKQAVLEEFRYFNFPIVTDKYKIEIGTTLQLRLLTGGAALRVELLSSDLDEPRFEKLETIKTAKGLAQVVALRKLNFATRPGQENCLRFSIGPVMSNLPK
ncbi:MAG: hypothetical protein ONB27_07505 [candidate division KSB1 bacterium]|nr:hypothetical protein [candidate division KSB1 bacterium]